LDCVPAVVPAKGGSSA